MNRRFYRRAVFAFNRHCIGLLRQPLTAEFSAWFGILFFTSDSLFATFIISIAHPRFDFLLLLLLREACGRLFFYRCGIQNLGLSIMVRSLFFFHYGSTTSSQRKRGGFFYTWTYREWLLVFLLFTFFLLFFWHESYWKRAKGSNWETTTRTLGAAACLFLIFFVFFFYYYYWVFFTSALGLFMGNITLFGRRSAKTWDRREQLFWQSVCP